jgi:chlorite dismutase/nitrite reductase/ring-hydroxylating ferredoxin subunit
MNEGNQPNQPARRQVVKFSFYKVDAAWRSLSPADRELSKAELIDAVESFGGSLRVRSYSTVGLRGDADFLLWQIGESLDDVQALAAAIATTPLGPYLSMPYSYLAMTRPSVYVSEEESADRTVLHPSDSKYFFVYPFVKTREWYQLSLEERQEMMSEHIRIGRKYPSIKLNTTYSFGLDDQEFVVSFETDEPADFLDLVMELREAKTSMYTLRDTPIFTCIARNLSETLDTLVAPASAASSPQATPVGGAGWQRVAVLNDIPVGGSKLVYFRGEQVALFNVDGEILAVSNRCPHANGPLADGRLEDGTVTCPYHESRFDLRTGQPEGGPAARPVNIFRVRVDDGVVHLAPGEQMAETEEFGR